MSAITSHELDNRLRSIRGWVGLGGGGPIVLRYADALTKAPRPVIAWHLVRLAVRVLVGRT